MDISDGRNQRCFLEDSVTTITLSNSRESFPAGCFYPGKPAFGFHALQMEAHFQGLQKTNKKQKKKNKT